LKPRSQRLPASKAKKAAHAKAHDAAVAVAVAASANAAIFPHRAKRYRQTTAKLPSRNKS